MHIHTESFRDESMAYALAAGLVTFDEDRDCEKSMRRRRYQRRKGNGQ